MNKREIVSLTMIPHSHGAKVDPTFAWRQGWSHTRKEARTRPNWSRNIKQKQLDKLPSTRTNDRPAQRTGRTKDAEQNPSTTPTKEQMQRMKRKRGKQKPFWLGCPTPIAVVLPRTVNRVLPLTTSAHNQACEQAPHQFFTRQIRNWDPHQGS